MTKGEELVVLEHKVLSEETKSDWAFAKKKVAYLIDYIQTFATADNLRELELAQTKLEEAIFYMGKVIIKSQVDEKA